MRAALMVFKSPPDSVIWFQSVAKMQGFEFSHRQQRASSRDHAYCPFVLKSIAGEVNVESLSVQLALCLD